MSDNQDPVPMLGKRITFKSGQSAHALKKHNVQEWVICPCLEKKDNVQEWAICPCFKKHNVQEWVICPCFEKA